MNKIDFKKIKIIPLDNNHDLKNFSCKISDLNDFLKEDAYRQSKAMLNVTYLTLYDDEVLGYFTLSTDNIKISSLTEYYKEKFKDKDVYYKVFPAVKVGRLGVDKKFEKKCLGRFLFLQIIHHAIKVSKQIGFRFITIDSYVSAYDFYKKMECQDGIEREKIENKVNEFKRLISQNKLEKAHKITIFLFFDLYDFHLNILLKNHTSHNSLKLPS